MGKKRLYELAKELNMGNKELVEKLQEMGYPVKSHSSTIEEFLVKEIKERLLGKQQPADQSKKARPTVIRRRKKVVPPKEPDFEPVPETPPPLSEAGTEMEVQAESSPPSLAETVPIPSDIPETPIDKLAVREDTAAAEVDTPPEPEIFEGPAVVSQAKSDEATDMIQPEAIEEHEIGRQAEAKPPVVPETETVAEIQPESTQVEAKAEPMDEDSVEPVPSAVIREPAPVDITSEAQMEDSDQRLESGDHAMKADTAEVEPISEPPAKDVPKPPKSKKEHKRQAKSSQKPAAPEKPVDPLMNAKVKKIEKTTAEPAKIISRPVYIEPPKPKPEPVQQPKPAEPKKSAPYPPPAQRPPKFEAPPDESIPVAAASPADGKKGKKRKKGRDVVTTEDDFARRKKAVRRKEIIERTELYEKGNWDRPSRSRKSTRTSKKVKKTAITVPKAIKRRIKVVDTISVAELAKKMGIKSGDIIKKMMVMGVMANINQAIDYETACLVASEFDYEIEKGSFDEEEVLHMADFGSSQSEFRPPVVTVMGHVDHGKTSLLDTIRKTNVIDGEAGGITQHIGAYHVKVEGGNITFLDTPGHEAFTSMRARGAQVTDIVVLIVAADDGVMQQTKEAADHARAAGVPIIVAVNKVDKPEAEPDRIRREMADMGLVPESWGGDIIFVNISAKTGEGVDELLEMILLQSEILELKAPHEGRASGRIVEARLDKGRGPVATVLVQQGTLKPGDPFVCGVYSGKIRGMLDSLGQRVDQAGPSIPVEIQGIGGVPQAGDEFIVVDDEKQAKQVSQHRLLKQRESELNKTSRLTLETLFDNIKEGAAKELNIVLRADVQGSLEAITEALHKLEREDIKVNIVRSAIGAITESDILLASASEALIVGFNVRPNSKVVELAELENIQIRFYDVIYRLIDEIKEAMAGLLEPIQEEEVLGRAEVRQSFHVSKVGTIAGSAVLDGKIIRGANARLLRNDVVVYDGRIGSLKRFKEDAKEVLTGYECGIGLDNYNDIKPGDIIEAYVIKEVAATLD